MRKIVEKVYMREVLDYDWIFEKDDNTNCYIALKHIKKVTQPVIKYFENKEYTRLDNGFSILEYIPLDKKYNCRVFMDCQNKPLYFYFDVNNGCGIENGNLWYEDMYLDVKVLCPNITGHGYFIFLHDKVDLDNALNSGAISKLDYDEAYKTANYLLNELEKRGGDFWCLKNCEKDVVRLKEKIAKK